MLIDDCFIVLAVNPQEVLIQDEEPSRFLYHTTGTINWLNEDEDRIQIGRFGLYYVDAIGAERAGESLFNVYDSDSSTVDYLSLYTTQRPR